MSQVPEDYNKGGYYTFLGSLIFVCLFIVYLLVFHPTVDLQQNMRDPNAPVAEETPAADEASAPEESTEKAPNEGGDPSSAEPPAPESESEGASE